MDNPTTTQLEFAPLKSKTITALFDEPRVSSDGGVLLLREVDRQLGLMDRLAEVITDNRRPRPRAPATDVLQYLRRRALLHALPCL
jgi:hypothetical protein